MNKNCYCGSAFLAALIVVFSLWEISFSRWIVLVSAILIFLKSVVYLAKYGCACKGSCGSKKVGSDLIMEKTDEELHEGPSKQEVKETLKKKKEVKE